MILLATSRGSILYSPWAIISLSCLTFSARSSSPLPTSRWAIFCDSRDSLEILTLADPKVRRTWVRLSRQAWPVAVSFFNNWENSAHERPLWMTCIILSPTFVSSASRQASLARSLFFHCGHYVAISKTCYHTIKPAWLSSKWSGAGTFGRSVSRDGGPQKVVSVVEGG